MITVVTQNMKICIKCKLDKPITAYYRRGGANNHLFQSQCKSCRKGITTVSKVAKCCRRCQETKPRIEFNFIQGSAQRRQQICKDCKFLDTSESLTGLTKEILSCNEMYTEYIKAWLGVNPKVS